MATLFVLLDIGLALVAYAGQVGFARIRKLTAWTNTTFCRAKPGVTGGSKRPSSACASASRSQRTHAKSVITWVTWRGGIWPPWP